MFTFSEVLRDVGLKKVSEATGRSLRQIYKWERNNTLPRSDYTGETKLSAAISLASDGKYSEQEILNSAMPGRKKYSSSVNSED
ncbi:TPA: Cro/Cl family transcriptional regulator [Yersinia enterocolitica]|uniref:Cro/Cl family transcriptional regulator n=1 Tax=Yersinia enterocolitica TaxID=630 RepID=UPI00363C4F55